MKSLLATLVLFVLALPTIGSEGAGPDDPTDCGPALDLATREVEGITANCNGSGSSRSCLEEYGFLCQVAPDEGSSSLTCTLKRESGRIFEVRRASSDGELMYLELE